MGKKLKGKKLKQVPDGSYKVELKELEETKGQYGPALRGIFVVTEGLEKTNELSCTFPVEHTSRNKLGAFIKAALGAYDHDYDYDSDELIDCEVMVLVENITTPDGEFSKIVNFWSVKKKGKKQ